MKVRFFFISLLIALNAFWSFQASSQATVTVTVFWTTGWCNICGPTTGNYACAIGSGSGNWNAGIRTFADPVPAGETVCQVDVTVNKVDCGLTNLCVLLNGNSLGCLPPTVGSNCSCGACWPLFYSKAECPFGSYVYGGINTIDLNNVGNLCVNNCVIDITYSSSCNCLIPLPIDLLSFNAKYNGSTVDLTWATASETNNDYFTIERSLDEENFVTIGTVKGKGRSSFENQYSIEDIEPYSGLAYYRLKQTDNNGKSEYSDLVSLNIEYEDNFFTLAPNPAIDMTELSFYSFRNEDITVVMYDATGRLVRTVSVKSNPGLNIISMDTHHLQKGIYHVVLTGVDKVRTSKLVIDR